MEKASPLLFLSTWGNTLYVVRELEKEGVDGGGRYFLCSHPEKKG